MFVRINDYISKMRYAVTQERVLAPLFFLLNINDISNVIKNSKILLYADNLTLYRVVNMLMMLLCFNKT